MRSIPTRIAVAAAALAMAGVPASAAAARTVTYTGKTSSGHKITFTSKNGRVKDLTAGIRMSCLAIQGGGAPVGGSEVFGFRGSLPFQEHNRYTFMEKPAFHYNEVTMNNDLWLKRRGSRVISGRMRLQYQFLIPKYPPGTFSVYSCLGGGTFTARARS
jgi:hypothetical protein